MSHVGSVSQMMNVIMSQDSSDIRQSPGGISHVEHTHGQQINHGLDSVIPNGSSLLSEVEHVLSSPGTGSMSTAVHDMQTQQITFKREIMDTEVSPY